MARPCNISTFLLSLSLSLSLSHSHYFPANCGLPSFPRDGYGQLYLDNNTMEGTRVLFICSNDVQHSLEQAHVAVCICNPDGKWQPNPGNFCIGRYVHF